MRNSREQSERAFTLVELLLVMFIIALLATTGAPLFSKLVQGSRVQQGVAAVESALFHARSEAQNLRLQVAVYYGDNLNGLVTTPNPVPPPGSIEVWSVRGSSGYGSFGGYGATLPFDPSNANPAWYPFRFTVKLINKQPITLPSSVRVIAGRFRRVWNGSGYNCVFDFPSYRKDSVGEIKRHHTVFSQRGGLVRNDCAYAYNHLLVFDETSGEHAVMEAGRCQTATRPRRMPYMLTHVGGTKLTDFRQIGPLINNFPGNM
jgi:prepilin-type N-terminal cleavage/methylation domain-containing protein